jgi:glycosyltransferase involved in cell wall biosynthesis
VTEDPAAAPLFSIVTPVYNTPLDVLEQMVDSVVDQSLDDWELVLVDDCSTDDGVRQLLRTRAEADPRIILIERAENGHIVVASNDGVRAARGQFIALLDHDDLLVPHALERMAAAIAAEPEVDYLYSDEDKVDPAGRFFDEFTKPGWSPEQLRGHMYTCHFSVLRTSLVREVGGFHVGYEGSQDHDLALRVTERARKIVHVPEILYHWRVVPGSAAGDPHAKPYAWVAGVKAVQAHLDRLGIEAQVSFGPGQGTYQIDRRLDPAVRVSVVVPTAGADGLVWGRRRHFVIDAVRSLIELGGHENLEIIVVHDPGIPRTLMQRLHEIGAAHVRLVRYDGQFDFSRVCNVGVLASSGEAIVLMNDDTEVSSPEFVVQLVAPLFEEGVGMTGARLLAPDGRVRHGGLALDTRLDALLSEGRVMNSGPFHVRDNARARVGSSLSVNRECSGLSAACLAITRSLYDEVGGLSEQFPANFGDVDLSLKVASLGYRILWIAHATAYHFESRTRQPWVTPREFRALAERWELPDHDPYLPHLPESPPRHSLRTRSYSVSTGGFGGSARPAPS